MPEQDAPALDNTPALWRAQLPWPTADSHKHSRGRLVVVGGGEPWTTGAARLSARAGLRAGAGLVTLLAPSETVAANAAHLEAVMLRPFHTAVELAALAKDADAAVIGPAAGVTQQTHDNLFALAETGAALVIDADALTVCADDPRELWAVLDRDDVLTPHEGEFGRIFPGLLPEERRGEAADRDAQRLHAAREAAARAGAVVLLKGFATVVAAPDGRAAVNRAGCAWLATAGSGDVLAGMVGALVAQGMDSFLAACAAVWMHADAARRHGPGLIAEDLPGLLPAVLTDLLPAA